MKEIDADKELQERNNEKKKERKWKFYNKKKEPIEAIIEDEKEKVENPPKAVIFVPNTDNSELASEVRDMIQKLRPWTSINLKVVERAGDKIADILCKSNPWDSVDCKRKDCFTCESTVGTEKLRIKNCRQRSVIYET